MGNAGFALGEALAWRDAFDELGWLEVPDWRPQELASLQEMGIVPEESTRNDDPWILCCPVEDSPGMILRVTLGGQYLANVQPKSAAARSALFLVHGDSVLRAKSKFRPKGYIIATRRQIAYVGRSSISFQIADISNYSVAGRVGWRDVFGSRDLYWKENKVSCSLTIRGQGELTFDVRSFEDGFFQRNARTLAVIGNQPGLAKPALERKAAFIELMDSFLSAARDAA